MEILELLYGQYLIITGALLVVSTIKRPEFLGGQKHRYTSDDTTNAMLARASRRSLAGWLVFAGVMMWLVGI